MLMKGDGCYLVFGIIIITVLASCAAYRLQIESTFIQSYEDQDITWESDLVPVAATAATKDAGEEGRTYLVMKTGRTPNDMQHAADLLDSINNRLLDLIGVMEVEVEVTGRGARFRELLNAVIKATTKNEVGHQRISELANPGEKAVNDNKGSMIYLCLDGRQSSDGVSVMNDLNTLMYVTLHEIAHTATVSYGHTAEFWENFRSILHAAKCSGSYTYTDFKEGLVPFCGTLLKDDVDVPTTTCTFRSV